MASTPSGTMDRARFGQKMRDLREQASIGGVEAARLIGISQSKLSKLETGRLRPDPDDIRALCDVYGVSPGERESLVQVARSLREASQLGRVTLSRNAARLQDRIGRLEARASLLRSFQPAMVIGLLQIAEYAHVVVSEILTDGDVEAAVESRMKRQNVLNDPNKECVLIMSEGALRWQVGSPRIMADQVDAIVAATRLPNIRLGIVPWTTPVNVTTTHGFHLYDAAAVIFGTETAAGVLDTPEDIDAYVALFERLERVASFDDAARRELTRIASDYRLLDR